MTLTSLPVSKLAVSEDNPRAALGDLGDLAASIKAVGIVEPLVVTPNGKGYILVSGARRLAAAKKAGLKEVPVIVRELTDEQIREARLIENLQRTDLSPLEEASAYQGLLEVPGYTQRKLAERIGRSQGQISKRLALLKLTPKARAKLDAGGITVEDALELTKLAEHPERIDKVVAEGRISDWTVRNELREVDRDAKIAKATADLQRQGTKIVGWETGGYGQPKLKGSAVLVTEQYEYGAHVKMVPKDHVKEPCHAAAIDREGKILEVCTSPKSHPKQHVPAGGYNSTTGRRQPGGLTEKEKAARKAKREHTKAIREAQAERWLFLRALFRRRIAAGHKDAALRFVVKEWVDREAGVSWSNVGRSACDLLGLKNANAYNWRDPILRALTKNPDDALRIALAVGVGSFEDGIRLDIGLQAPSAWISARPYFEWLKEQGYKPSEAERIAVAGKAPQ